MIRMMGLLRHEIPSQNVLRHGMRVIRIGRRPPELPRRLRPNPRRTHHFHHRLAIARRTSLSQRAIHTHRTVRLTAEPMNFANFLGQRDSSRGRHARRTFPPRIKPAARHPQHVARNRNRNRPLAAMPLDEGVSHRDSFAKKAVAFFRSHAPSAAGRSRTADDGSPSPTPSAEPPRKRLRATFGQLIPPLPQKILANLQPPSRLGDTQPLPSQRRHRLDLELLRQHSTLQQKLRSSRVTMRAALRAQKTWESPN